MKTTPTDGVATDSEDGSMTIEDRVEKLERDVRKLYRTQTVLGIAIIVALILARIL